MAVVGGPGDDFVDLRPGGGDTADGDVDAEDEVEVVGLGGRGDVGEAAAVCAVETDGGESFCGYGSDV